MTEQALRKMIAAGESTRQEFKSWVKCKDYRQRKDLAVKVRLRWQIQRAAFCCLVWKMTAPLQLPQERPAGTDGSHLRYDSAQPVYRN